MTTTETALARIKPRRRIHRVTAVLLPFDAQGRIQWDDFEAPLKRTVDANPGLRWVHTTPAGGGSQVKAAQDR